jgi:hypothetical protein
MSKLSFKFGFCFYNSKIALKECEKCENILLENKIMFSRDDRMYNFKETFKSKELLNSRINEVRNLMLENNVKKYVIFESY